jgi:hypothetical protein
MLTEDDPDAVVHRWEQVQCRVAFLLPVVRAVELAWLALVATVILFLASAHGGFLLALADHYWGRSAQPAELFAPTFTALALMVGFFSGPYIEAARTMRAEADGFAAISSRALARLSPGGDGFASDYVEIDELRQVVKNSHEYVRAKPINLESESDLARHAESLAHYWGKRAGHATLPESGTMITARYRHVLRSILIVTSAMVGLVAVVTAFGIDVAANGLRGWHVLAVVPGDVPNAGAWWPVAER